MVVTDSHSVIRDLKIGHNGRLERLDAYTAVWGHDHTKGAKIFNLRFGLQNRGRWRSAKLASSFFRRRLSYWRRVSHFKRRIRIRRIRVQIKARKFPKLVDVFIWTFLSQANTFCVKEIFSWYKYSFTLKRRLKSTLFPFFSAIFLCHGGWL